MHAHSNESSTNECFVPAISHDCKLRVHVSHSNLAGKLSPLLLMGEYSSFFAAVRDLLCLFVFIFFFFLLHRVRLPETCVLFHNERLVLSVLSSAYCLIRVLVIRP